MKGSLVKYIDIDCGVVFGVITTNAEYHEEYNSEAVVVIWFDDGQPTYESLENLYDPTSDYIEVISESR